MASTTKGQTNINSDGIPSFVDIDKDNIIATIYTVRCQDSHTTIFANTNRTCFSNPGFTGPQSFLKCGGLRFSFDEKF